MIAKFLEKILRVPGGRRKRGTDFGRRVEVPVEKHHIDPSLVDERALKVVNGLREAGYEAYIVGGAVRDLLLGLPPKDFDVATNATPEQVKSLFRRAFIIGRRFRIVHVVYGRGREHEVIEVSTFRAYMNAETAETVHGNERTAKAELADKRLAIDESGRVLRDNVWGPQEEDAARRDFTINAMYYDPARQIVVDYHNGLRDAKKHVLRMIGDAAIRYREDPVRILRVVRFAAKLAPLGFDIDPKTRAPIHECLALLRNVPISRMFDEMLKLLQTGHAQASIASLRREGLEGVFPMLDGLIRDESRYPLAWLALADTDRRVGEGKPVSPSFMLAALLWQEVQTRWKRLEAAGEHTVPALQQAIDEVFDARIGDISGRGRLAADMREIWQMQPRFERRTGNSPLGMVAQPRFRAAFDFMRLRAAAGEVPQELADWWETFSTADDAHRGDMLQAVHAVAAAAGTGAAKKKRRRRRKPAADGEGSQAPAGPTADGAQPAA